jgi:PAS domain S-box-containing protein
MTKANDAKANVRKAGKKLRAANVLPSREKSRQEDTQLSEIRYRTIIEQSPLSTQILSPDGSTLQVNKAWEELWGATFEQLKDYNMLEDKQLVGLGIMPYIKKGFKGKPTLIPAVKYEPGKNITGPNIVPYRWVRAFIYPVKDNKGTVREVVLVHEDITEQKKAEEALQQSEERLRFMAESMPQKIFTATPYGKIDYFNPQWMEFTGLSFEQIKGWGWTQFIHPDDVEDNIARWQHSIDTGEPFAFENRFRRHDGQYRWHVSRARAMRDENGNIIMWIGSNTDIHDIKIALQHERELEEKTASLAKQHSQLVALNQAKDEFISLASHQLRTPATGVKQYLGMVLQGYAGNISEEQRAFLEQAFGSNERQITIINDLLKVARVDAGEVTLNKEKTDIVPLLQDIINEQAAKFAERDQKLVFEPKQSSLKATIDKANLRMVLENIIDNASKYSPQGKTIEVSAKKSKGVLIITIKDEGVGIAQKDVDKIFAKFSRLDNPLSVVVSGTGLGLYWAKKIIDLHGGTVDVASEVDKGTTFKLNLPL